jgi:hypothetical protein
MGIGKIKLTIKMQYVHCQQVFCDEKKDFFIRLQQDRLTMLLQ